MRMTRALVAVALALLEDPADRHWGYDLSRRAQVASGSLYPLLSRLLNEGWLEDGWEDAGTFSGRPPRRYYTLTEKGLRGLGAIIASAEQDPRWGPRWQLPPTEA